MTLLLLFAPRRQTPTAAASRSRHSLLNAKLLHTTVHCAVFPKHHHNFDKIQHTGGCANVPTHVRRQHQLGESIAPHFLGESRDIESKSGRKDRKEHQYVCDNCRIGSTASQVGPLSQRQQAVGAARNKDNQSTTSIRWMPPTAPSLQCDADDKQRRSNRDMQRLPQRKALETEKESEQIAMTNEQHDTAIVDLIASASHILIVMAEQRMEHGRGRKARDGSGEKEMPRQLFSKRPVTRDGRQRPSERTHGTQSDEHGGPEMRVNGGGFVVHSGAARMKTMKYRELRQTIAVVNEWNAHCGRQACVVAMNDFHRRNTTHR